jgi:hypothetical protein
LVTPWDHFKPEMPTNHPDPPLVIGSFPLGDTIPRKLVPSDEEEKQQQHER